MFKSNIYLQNYQRDVLMHKAQEYSIALSMLNIDMLCKQQGCAYYDYNNHGIVLLFINPKYNFNTIVGLTHKMNHITSQILVLQDNLYRFVKDRVDYTRTFTQQQDYTKYIKQCHNYTMHCYELDGIL